MPDHSEKKGQVKQSAEQTDNSRLSRRNMLLGTSTLVAAATMASGALAQAQKTAPNAAPAPSGRKPNILVIFGDDIGQTNVSAYSFGLMGYRTPNIDRIAKEGMMFTDYYAEQSCTAGRSSFITGQCVDGDRNGAASRRLRGGLRLCKCGVVGCGQQQAGADLNAKVFHGFALLVY